MDKVQMAALAQKAKAGDRQAFTLLYRQLVGAIYAYFFVRLGAKLYPPNSGLQLLSWNQLEIIGQQS